MDATRNSTGSAGRNSDQPELMLLPRPKFEALVAKSEIGSSEPTSLRGYDPLARALKDNPTLTREKVEEMAQAFGF